MVDKLTQEQSAIIGAYTGVLCGDFSVMHEYVERIMGRPVFTHEMGNKEIAREIKEAAKDDFLNLCATK